MIERLSEGMGGVGRSLCLQQPLANSIEISFHMNKKSDSSLPEIYQLQSIKTLLTLELSKYRKSGSMFSSTEPVAASSDCC